MKRSTSRALWIGGTAAAAVGVVAGAVMLTRKSSSTSSTTPPAGSAGGTGPKQPSAPVVPDVATPGPYTALSIPSLQPGEVYLYELPVVASSTFANTLAALQAIKSMQVLQSWDAGQQPASWPSAATGVWRFVLQWGTKPLISAGKFGVKVSPITLPPRPGQKLWATGGQSL